MSGNAHKHDNNLRSKLFRRPTIDKRGQARIIVQNLAEPVQVMIILFRAKTSHAVMGASKEETMEWGEMPPR